MTTVREKWRQAEKLCDTKGWHCHPHAVTPPFPHHTGTLHLSLESCSRVPRGCGQWVLSSTLHPVAGSPFTRLFLPLSTTSSGFKFSLAVHQQLFTQTPHFLFSDERPVAQNPLSLWETPREDQELGKQAAGTAQDLSKRKSEGQTRSSLCFSKINDSGDYRDSCSSLSSLWWLVSAPQQQSYATATQQARKSK